jgi:parvulin-like peptidyl-prolyl isomerase
MNKSWAALVMVPSLCIAGGIGWYVGKNHQSAPIEINNEQVLAVINGEIISKNDFLQQMKLHGGLKPGQFQDLTQRQQLLKYLINQEAMFSNAKEKGITDDPVVTKLFKKAVIDRYLELELNPRLEKVRVTSSEVRKYFENNKTSYDKPARRRGAMIFVEFNKKDTEENKIEKRQKINEALEKVLELDSKTLHFGEIAKAYSDDKNSRYQGGVMGWLINHPARKYRWEDDVVDALFKLEKNGDVSPVLETPKGLYIVRLVSAENVVEKQLTKVEKGIKNSLRQKKKKQIKIDFIEELNNSAEISINQDLLAEIQPISKPKKDKTPKPPALPGKSGESS